MMAEATILFSWFGLLGVDRRKYLVRKGCPRFSWFNVALIRASSVIYANLNVTFYFCICCREEFQMWA
jgi:hypothetical protein